MLKWYADTFKLGGAELTAANLKSLKRYTLLGLPCLVLYPLGMFDILPIWSKLIVLILALISSCFMCVVMMSPFTNRFWARDKYLDEWERGRKHHAMAIGHQMTDYMFAAFAVICFGLAFFGQQDVTLSFTLIGSIFIYFVIFMVLVPHMFLLWTVKPVEAPDEIDADSLQAEATRGGSRLIFWMIVIGVGFVSGLAYAVFAGPEINTFYDAGYELGRKLGTSGKGE